MCEVLSPPVRPPRLYSRGDAASVPRQQRQPCRQPADEGAQPGAAAKVSNKRRRRDGAAADQGAGGGPAAVGGSGARWWRAPAPGATAAAAGRHSTRPGRSTAPRCPPYGAAPRRQRDFRGRAALGAGSCASPQGGVWLAPFCQHPRRLPPGPGAIRHGGCWAGVPFTARPV